VSLLEYLAKWKEVVNNESVILRNTDNICFPSWHVGMLKVHCPENYRDEILLVEPTTLPNSLVIGGAVIQPNKDAYIPVMNVSNEEVRMKRGAFVAHGAHITDPRMLIGLEEEFTEEEYVNFVSRGRERVGADSDVTERKEKVSQEVKSSGRGKVEKEGATRKSSVKMKLENSDFKGKSPRQGDLLEELELEQLDRLPPFNKNPLKGDKYVKETIDKLISASECPEKLVGKLRTLLWEHRNVLAESGDPVGLCTAYKPRIPLDTKEPVYTPQYPVPYGMRAHMREAIKEFLEMGVVKPSTSPYNSPSLMVPKRDGGYRLVVDFRRLNKHVITDPHPLPRISQIMETLGEAQVLTALDLLHGFYNLEVAPEDREKTAFSTFEGHWEFIRLPMGLKNSPSIFQRLMQIVLSGCLGHHAFIYRRYFILFKGPRTTS
jgi:hypothetical protein